jgi:DNA-binding NarL/FixJ family response regulator
MIRIVIADDHAIVRRGLRQLVSEESDITVVGEATNAQELLTLLRQHACDALLLDISMPGRTGLEILRELRQEHPRLPILLLTMHPEEQFAVRALRAGAAAYLTKETAPEDLVVAIRKVIRGGRYITPSLAEKLAADLADGTERPRHEALSEREHQVLRLLGAGRSVTQIADELCLSVKTISTYRARILEKMGMKTNAELIHYAIKNQLVT